MKKISTPEEFIIEKTAAEMAGVFFDAARSSGMGLIQLQGEKIDLRKFKNNPRKFAYAHLEKFIPAAVHALTEIMCRDTTPIEHRDLIQRAILERVNDTDLAELGKMAKLPEFEATPLYSADNAKPKPVIVNTPKIDFDFNSKRVN